MQEFLRHAAGVPICNERLYVLATTVKRDYYEVLSVSRTATDQEIKSAYRKLALQFHPDRNPDNPDAEEQFKECSEAYAVLADSEKRARYDRFGHAGVGSGTAEQGGGFDPTVFNDFHDIFGDIFGFGDMFGRPGPDAARARSAAPTCAKTSPWNLKKPSSASPSR